MKLTLCLLLAPALFAQGNPSTSTPFSQVVKGMTVVQNSVFGTGPNGSISDVTKLTAAFNPYAIAGTTVINQEWQRYQPFNATNFVFTNHSLDLTAVIPPGGGVWDGGINSGQIASKQTLKPGASGYAMYAIEVRMKIPVGPGAWPATWLYTQSGAAGMNDGSEIDNAEFFVAMWQNQFDWTGFSHGPGVGAQVYSIMTNEWVWHPGTDFSADYHDYQMLWTADSVYKYVDGQLILAQKFKWTAQGQAQLIVNLAVGSPIMPGFVPTNVNQFPKVLSIEHITIWGK